ALADVGRRDTADAAAAARRGKGLTVAGQRLVARGEASDAESAVADRPGSEREARPPRSHHGAREAGGAAARARASAAGRGLARGQLRLARRLPQQPPRDLRDEQQPRSLPRDDAPPREAPREPPAQA